MDTRFVVAPTMSKKLFNGLETYLPEDIQLVITNETNESNINKIAFQKELAESYIEKYKNTLDEYQSYANAFNPENYDALSAIDRRQQRLDKFNNDFNDPNNYPNYLRRGAYNLIHKTIQPQLDYQYNELNKDHNNASLISLGLTRKYGEEAFLTNHLDLFYNRPNIDERKAVLQKNLTNLDYRLNDLNSLAKTMESYEPLTLDMYKPKQEKIANEIREEQNRIKEMKYLMQTNLNSIEQPGYGERAPGCVIV